MAVNGTDSEAFKTKSTAMRRGKAVCEALKDVRRKIAQVNDINYSPGECHHEGECAGTCAASLERQCVWRVCHWGLWLFLEVVSVARQQGL